jgi:hypothetical protein
VNSKLLTIIYSSIYDLAPACLSNFIVFHSFSFLVVKDSTSSNLSSTLEEIHPHASKHWISANLTDMVGLWKLRRVFFHPLHVSVFQWSPESMPLSTHCIWLDWCE